MMPSSLTRLFRSSAIQRVCLSLVSFAALSAVYGARLDPSARINLDSRGIVGKSVSSRADDEKPPYLPLILQVADDEAIDSLQKWQVIVYHRRDDMLLTSVPRERLQDVIGCDGILNIASMGRLTSNMDVARVFGHVDAAQSGLGLDEVGYDGSGVVVGFSDVGFDAHHVAFEGRVSQIFDYDTAMGVRLSATDASEIAAWTTDSDDQWHATHVANILAGGYKGNPYYGVATGAEIVATTSRLYEPGILAGVEDVIAYAKSQGRRAVINLSISNYNGPHDGTDLLCRYLSACAKDAVICVSAGNTGSVNGYATQQLSKDTAMVTVNSLATWDGFEVNGMTDIWSDSDEPFEFCIEVYDRDARQVVFSSPWIMGEDFVMVSPTEFPEWGQYMDGMVYAESGWSDLNGRYTVSIAYDTKTEVRSVDGAWSRYYTCLTARRPENVNRDISVDYFADAIHSFLGKLSINSTKVSSLGSISDMATAEDIISVGMANSRNTAPSISGAPLKWSSVIVDEINKASSYSATPSIEPLPTISAPGCYVVSAMSGEFIAKYPESVKAMSAVCNVDGKDYYWYATNGTSMASPFVAGVIALWLQADDTLTVDEIVDIMRSTATTDYADFDNPRWGAGCINALAGLKEIKSRGGVSDIEMPVNVSVDANGHIITEGIDRSNIRIYNISGASVAQSSALAPGVYIIRYLNTTRKLLVR